MKPSSSPCWFRLPSAVRLLWLLWALISAPLRRRYGWQPHQLHAVLIVRDLYSFLPALVEEMHAEGIPYAQILLLNTGSSASPCMALLKLLQQRGCRILTASPASLAQGPYAIWLDPSLALPAGFWRYPFVLTDPDLDLTGIPRGWLRTLMQLLNQQRWASKLALGLRTDDLTAPAVDAVRHWEQQLSQRFPYGLLNRLMPNCALPTRICPTDTTLALYRPLRHFTTLAIRLEGPYRMRHLPWYAAFVQSPEYAYYQSHKQPAFGHWSSR
jgi:hypothetical protein